MALHEEPTPLIRGKMFALGAHNIPPCERKSLSVHDSPYEEITLPAPQRGGRVS